MLGASGAARCLWLARRGSRMPNVLAGVNLSREEAYLQMLARAFRPKTQVVTMHRPNEASYSRPGLYVLDDWR